MKFFLPGKAFPRRGGPIKKAYPGAPDIPAAGLAARPTTLARPPPGARGPRGGGWRGKSGGWRGEDVLLPEIPDLLALTAGIHNVHGDATQELSALTE